MSLDNFILECEKDNKNLEDTIKVLKNKIQRLTKENERLNGAIQTYNILLKSNIKENEELKSQLRGTTHCFDEEEHKRLEEENKELKKQLEEYQLQNTDLRADIMIQKQAIPNKLIKDKSFYDLYDMPTYEDLLTQQKEFIKYLENEIKLYENDIQNFKKDYKVYSLLINDLRVSKAKMEEILNKYKETIGDDKNAL